MNLEGKVMGYDKKIIAIVAIVILALVMFYAGTRYEKMKLGAGKATKSTQTDDSSKKKKDKKQPAAVEQNATPGAPTTDATTATPTPEPTKTTTSTSVTQTKATK